MEDKTTHECLIDAREAFSILKYTIAKELAIFKILDWLTIKLKRLETI